MFNKDLDLNLFKLIRGKVLQFFIILNQCYKDCTYDSVLLYITSVGQWMDYQEHHKCECDLITFCVPQCCSSIVITIHYFYVI